jgi:hypothetical protein
MPLVRSSVKLPPDIWAQINSMLGPGDSFQEWLLDAAMRKLSVLSNPTLSPEHPNAEPHLIPISVACVYAKDNESWHDKLEKILVDGTNDDRKGIQTNLDWAVNCIRNRPKNEKRKSGKS